MNDQIAAVQENLRRAGQTVDLTGAIKPRGVVHKVGDGVALISGLPHVRFEELLAFDSGASGMAFELRTDDLGAVLLGGRDTVCEGEGVVGTGRLPDIGVGPDTLGRILDPLGNPLDDGPGILATDRLPLFRPAPEIIERRKVDQTLWTGVLAVDAAIPIGRGQRELIIGDRDIGKTSLAIDFVAAQRSGDVVCVYVVIGQPMSRVLGLRDTLERAGCLSNTALIAAPSSSSPGLQYLAPYAGASVAEYFRDRGGHAPDCLRRSHKTCRRLPGAGPALGPAAGPRSLSGRHLSRSRRAVGTGRRFEPGTGRRQRHCLPSGRNQRWRHLGLHPDQPDLDHRRPDFSREGPL